MLVPQDPGRAPHYGGKIWKTASSNISGFGQEWNLEVTVLSIDACDLDRVGKNPHLEPVIT